MYIWTILRSEYELAHGVLLHCREFENSNGYQKNAKLKAIQYLDILKKGDT